MKIIDALKPSSVTFVSQKEDKTRCSNCGKLNVKHDADHKENCIRARYLRV